MKEWKCPNCGSPYNPAKFRCEYCGSFIVMSDEKEFTIPRETVSQMKQEIAQANNNPDKYPGIYFFGSLMGKGEVPLRLGAANYYKNILNAVGGKLLLTGKKLYFSTHTILQAKGDLCIDIHDIENVTYERNMIVSDHIAVHACGKKHTFVVYGGKEWVSMIENAVETAKNATATTDTVNKLPVTNQGDYTDELVRLKQLCDSGVITEEEFAIKKRQLLGI